MPCEVTQPKSIRSESPDLVTNAFYSIVELEHRDSENLRTSRVRLSHSHPVVASVHRYLLSLISSSSSSSSSQCGIKPRKLPYFLLLPIHLWRKPVSSQATHSGKAASCLVDPKSPSCRAINPSSSQASLFILGAAFIPHPPIQSFSQEIPRPWM